MNESDFALHPNYVIDLCIELILSRYAKIHTKFYDSSDEDDDNNEDKNDQNNNEDEGDYNGGTMFDPERRKKRENVQLVTYIWNLMKRFQVYMIFELDNIDDGDDVDEQEYVIQAVIVVELYCMIAEKKTPIIHLAACKFSADATSLFDILMAHVFANSYYSDSTVYFIKSVPGTRYLTTNADDHDMRCVDISDKMKKLGFNDAPEGCLYELADKKSKVMSCERRVFYEKISGKRDKDATYRVCLVDKAKKVFAYYHDNKFSFFSHSFGWTKASGYDMTLLSQREQRTCKKMNGQAFALKGSGFRPESIHRPSMKERVCGIRQRFYQHHYITESNCAWLSAAMLIYEVDKKTARYMTDLLKKDPNKYDWLALMRVPKDRVQINEHTLQSLLQKDKNIYFTLKKVPQKMPYLDLMLDESTTGKYICQLCTNAGSETHVIGIDCDQKKVFDCMEKVVLRLRKRNIDHCCGPNENGIKKITKCYQIVATQKPKKK